MSLPSTAGLTIDAMSKLKDDMRKLEQKLKPLKDEYSALEIHLIGQLEAQDQTRGAGKKASVTLSKADVPSVEDWETFHAFIGKKKYYHLLERRASVSGCRELFEQGKKIPGVVAVPRKSIRLTQLKS